MKNIISALKQTDIFREADEARLAKIVLESQKIDLTKGGVVCESGQAFNYLVYLNSGLLKSVEIGEGGRCTAISNLHPGQVFGWLYLFGPKVRRETLFAIQDSEIFLMDLTQIASLLLETQSSARVVCKKLTQVIFGLKQDIVMLGRQAAMGRVLGVLAKYIVSKDGQYYLANAPKQHEIANLSNTTRETVSRTVSQLLSAGVVQKNGSIFRVEKPSIFGLNECDSR